MEQINVNIKSCATCACWLGQRLPNRLGFVEIINKMETARCGARGLNERRQYQATYCCSKYCRWQVI